MSDIRCTKIRLRDGSLPLVREWAAEINARKEEALATLRDEGVTFEAYFLDRTEHGDYLIGFMRAGDLDAAAEVVAHSPHPIDAYHQAFKRDTWESGERLELLVDLENVEAGGAFGTRP
jgi:hypothetical protein